MLSFSLLTTVAASALLLLSSFPGTVDAATRSLYLNNHCSQDVYTHATAGSAPFAHGKSSCANDGDCIAGATCWASKGTPICFYKVPQPDSGNWKVPAGGSSRMQFPTYNNGIDIVWSGNFEGCVGNGCGAPLAQCARDGCGPNGPVTMAEWTWSKTGTDFYDVSIINGINIPMSMGPRNVPGNRYDPHNSYECGIAGEVLAAGQTKSRTGTGHSSWNFQVPNQSYQFVVKGGRDCNTNADCGGVNGGGGIFGTQAVCGISDNVGHNPRFKKTCGALMGYWTADQICGAGDDSSPVLASFECNRQLNHLNNRQHGRYTMRNLLGCNGAGVDSCYQQHVDNTCCGCVNWQDFLPGQVPATTQRCTAENPEWASLVLPKLSWQKKACPTCYTYPYDDMSSTFTCTYGNPNNIDYEINFCPQNKRAKVSDATSEDDSSTEDADDETTEEDHTEEDNTEEDNTEEDSNESMPGMDMSVDVAQQQQQSSVQQNDSEVEQSVDQEVGLPDSTEEEVQSEIEKSIEWVENLLKTIRN